MAESRIRSIDAYRGIAIILMVLGNFAAAVRWVPSWLKHAPDIGFTIADAVAPAFVFSIALTAGLSFSRRRRQVGAGRAAGQIALRCLSLIGIGAVITAGQAMTPDPDRILSWGVLQALGAAGLILLPVLFLPTWSKLVLGILLLGAYQVILDAFYLEVVLMSSHNGLLGSISWAGFLVLGSSIADIFHRLSRKPSKLVFLLITGAVSSALALLLAIWLPISKNRASASYMLLSLGLCLLSFAFCHLIFSTQKDLAAWLCRIGRNPLMLYLAHLILLGLVRLPGRACWYENAPVWLSLIQAAALLGSIIGLSVLFERKRLIIRF